MTTSGRPSGFGFERPGAVAAAPGRAASAPGAAVPPPELPLLGDDDVVDVAGDEAQVQVAATLDALDAELVGLEHAKRRVREIAALLLVDRARRRFGLETSRPTLHMSFTGPPGTGKTTVGMRMAEMLHALGYIRTPKVHTVTRDDLVGQFIGHTAPRTKEAIAKAAGGVLFIDEAYYLVRPENERDYGQEVIEILLTEMESGRDSLVVIFAGYPDRMATFFAANPGLSSRVPHHIEFDDFTRPELERIADLMLASERFRLEDAARVAFTEYLELRMRQPRFANGRSVRNAIERMRLRQAKRLVEQGRPLTKKDLITLTESDVRGSGVFQHPSARDTPQPDDGGPAGAAGDRV